MGSLASLPDSGTVYVDSVVIIYSVDRHQTYASLLDPLWRASASGRVHVVTSELSLMETMVRPVAQNDPAAIREFEHFFASSLTTQIPIDRSILIRAALARAVRKSLRTPDAIHLATAFAAGAHHLLTNDRDLARCSTIAPVLVDDLVPKSPPNP